MQRLLLVDFDGTLFNSDLFHKDIATYLYNKYKTPLELFSESFDHAKKDGPHSLKKQLKIIGYRNVNGLIKEIKSYLMSTNQNYIYSDTLDFINKYKKEMVIFTFADVNYYKYKLAISKLNSHRIKVLAVDQDKNEFLRKNRELALNIKNVKSPEKVMWIDDKVSVFKTNIEGVDFIRIKREGSKHSNELTPSHIKEITNLLDIN